MNDNNFNSGPPTQVLRLVLSRERFEIEELILLTIISRRWRLAIFQELRNILFVNYTTSDEEQFLNNLEQRRMGGQYTELIYVGRSIRYRGITPFQESIVRLFLLCPNLRCIVIRHTNPLYILRNIRSAALYELRGIYVNWYTCRVTPSVLRTFYGANYVYRNTITILFIPHADDMDPAVVVEVGEERLTMAINVYLGLFPNLMHLITLD